MVPYRQRRLQCGVLEFATGLMGINCAYKRAWLATGTMLINLDLAKLGLSRGHLQDPRQSTTNDLHLFPKANLYPLGIMRSVMGIIRSMKSFGSKQLKLRHVCEISLRKRRRESGI